MTISHLSSRITTLAEFKATYREEGLPYSSGLDPVSKSCVYCVGRTVHTDPGRIALYHLRTFAVYAFGDYDFEYYGRSAEVKALRALWMAPTIVSQDSIPHMGEILVELREDLKVDAEATYTLNWIMERLRE